MVTINLLPWRKAIRHRKRRIFCAQALGLISLVLILSGFFWVKNNSQIKDQLADLQAVKTNNREIFSELEKFQSAQTLYSKQQQLVEHINKLIAKRQTIPQLLSLLGNSDLAFQTSYLSVNHQRIKLKGAAISTESALSLLNHLREESIFCQVTFTPLENKSTSLRTQFELQAELCNEQAN